MRKIFFLTISIFTISNVFGQAPLKNNPIHTELKFSVPQKNTGHQFNKTTVSDWYQPNKFVEADTMIGSTLVHLINFMQHDSLAKNVNANGSIDHNSWLSVGRVLDPKDTMISYTSNPQQKLSNYTSYTLDSIRFTYAYVRNTDSLTNGSSGKIAVTDTLFISYFKGNAIQKYSFNNTLNKYALINWKGDSIRMPSNYFTTDTVLLSKNDSTGIANIGGGFENFFNMKSFVHKAPAGININANNGYNTDNLIAYTLTFISGIKTVIGNDTAVMRYHKAPSTLPAGTRRTNYFGFSFAENKDLDTIAWQNPTYFNTSLLAPWWCAYTVSDNWYGYVPGNAYINEMFIDADFHLTTSSNASVIETKKNAFEVNSVFPNPVKIGEMSFITFNLKVRSEIQIEVYDLMGKMVKQFSNKSFEAGENTSELCMEGIDAGIYFLRVSVNGMMQTKKLSIIR